ncbi:reverse transcriptase-like protein, partial [Klebsiella pneumoniae]|uniref:reverse transcriptase-like protein n=1 Tax=Klebsiella pneumoniae TaxID=573 RepID=UPI0034DF94D9
MHFDGSKRKDGAGAGVILISPQGDKMKYVMRIQFTASNKKAKYEALIHRMWMAKSYGAKRLIIYDDSKLVVN